MCNKLKLEMNVNSDETLFLATCICALLYVGSEHDTLDPDYENDENLLKILQIIKKSNTDNNKERYMIVIPEGLVEDFKMALGYGLSFYNIHEMFKHVDTRLFKKYID